ncbi:unannotated protein [freshwater metagenome]|uniref:Unannotated protein n=1 Tax=freshwater metagenome TaxID=449393 RepID=A0A6J6P4G2_9ZZZZ
MMVRKAGIAIPKSSQSIDLICVIIKKPTITRAGVAASYGITATSGAKNVVSRKQIPVTTDAKPVRAPSPTPDADSI